MDVNALLEQLQQRAGLSSDQATKAVSVFTEFIQNNLSDEQVRAIASQVPGLGQFSGQIPEGVGDKIGNLLKGFGQR